MMKREVTRRKTSDPSFHAQPNHDRGAHSVDRALQVVETLAEDDEGCRLTDLAVRTELSPSTVHRLVKTLENRRQMLRLRFPAARNALGGGCLTAGQLQ
jgi:IclR family acetate operon transcriptional repressor